LNVDSSLTASQVAQKSEEEVMNAATKSDIDVKKEKDTLLVSLTNQH